MNRNGTEHKAVTGANAMAFGGKLSPDGQRVLYLQIEVPKGKAEHPGALRKLVVVDVATGNAMPVEGVPLHAYLQEFCWSPDGKRIAYTWREIHASEGSDMHMAVPPARAVPTESFLVVCDPDGKHRSTIATAKGANEWTVTIGHLEWVLIADKSGSSDAEKLAQLARAMKAERDPNVRRRILEKAVQIPGPDLEKFLIGVVTDEEDAGLRSEAATKLGLMGSDNCFPTLVKVARSDRTSLMIIGDVGGQSSARRAATFAIAELAARFPKLAGNATKELRALPAVDDANDGQGLADARLQALFQITRDNTLLTPFYERLKSANAKTREHGVVAFQFLKLKTAPIEITNALEDSDSGVRSWAALVLGRIADPKTRSALMAVAGNTKEDVSVRCNSIHSLGQMKAAAAADLMEKLLTDPSPAVQTNAAIALYRITGKKAKQFPEGYMAD
jgi:HEAT repeat protein